jgi:hypothetical protein
MAHRRQQLGVTATQPTGENEWQRHRETQDQSERAKPQRLEALNGAQPQRGTTRPDGQPVRDAARAEIPHNGQCENENERDQTRVCGQ